MTASKPDFDGRVALVTGASRGLGYAVARALALAGFTTTTTKTNTTSSEVAVHTTTKTRCAPHLRAARGSAVRPPCQVQLSGSEAARTTRRATLALEAKPAVCADGSFRNESSLSLDFGVCFVPSRIASSPSKLSSTKTRRDSRRLHSSGLRHWSSRRK